MVLTTSSVLSNDSVIALPRFARSAMPERAVTLIRSQARSSHSLAPLGAAAHAGPQVVEGDHVLRMNVDPVGEDLDRRGVGVAQLGDDQHRLGHVLVTGVAVDGDDAG